MNKYKTNLAEREVSSLLCADGAETLEFCATFFNDKDCILSFAIKDAYLGNTYGPNHLFSRIKRAWKAFIGKPIYCAEVLPNNTENILTWLEECKTTLNKVQEEGSEVL